MKISRDCRALDKINRAIGVHGGRGGILYYFAEDSRFMGVGRTPSAAVIDLRRQRSYYAGTYIDHSKPLHV